MLIHKNGDILNADENIICHQVNEDGVMGGGLALQIAKQYPSVEKLYKKFCLAQKRNKLYGQYFIYRVANKKYIANCFTQRDFRTNLKDIEQAFKRILKSCQEQGFSVCIPYKYGCGIADGNWDKVSKLFETLSNKYGVDISVYHLEKNESCK